MSIWSKFMNWGNKLKDEEIPVAEIVETVTPAESESNKIDNIIAELDQQKVEAALKELCAGHMKRLHQELVGENEDLLDRAIRKYRAKVARRTWHVAQKWCKWTDEGPVLMPDNTRLYYRKGDTEVIVQEYSPQVRLMKFKGALVQRQDTDGVLSTHEREKVYTYSLALPYIIFLYKFENGLFKDCYVTFSDRPMKRLQERPLRPFLSNLDSNLKLCHGPSFHRAELVQGDIIQQVALILNNFWSTIYSDEWSSHFWANKKHFSDVEDARMASMEAWQEASLDNPLFVVEDVNWLQHTEESFGDMVVRMFEHDLNDSSFQQELYTDLVENFLDEVKKVVDENVTSVEQKAIAGLDGLAKELLTQLVKSGKKAK